MGKFDMVVIVSPTWSLQPQTEEISDQGVVVFNKFHPYIFESLLEFQKQNKDCRTLLVVDDISSSYRREPHSLDKILTTARHYGEGISTVILAQRLSQLTTTARSQLDELCLFAEGNLRELKFLWGDYGSGIDFNGFVAMLRKHTEEKYSYIKIVNDTGRLYYKNSEGEDIIPYDYIVDKDKAKIFNPGGFKGTRGPYGSKRKKRDDIKPENDQDKRQKSS